MIREIKKESGKIDKKNKDYEKQVKYLRLSLPVVLERFENLEGVREEPEPINIFVKKDCNYYLKRLEEKANKILEKVSEKNLNDLIFRDVTQSKRNWCPKHEDKKHKQKIEELTLKGGRRNFLRDQAEQEPSSLLTKEEMIKTGLSK